jgi:GntR family transcriptional regulator, arabinose operon transcriptional repressor
MVEYFRCTDTSAGRPALLQKSHWRIRVKQITLETRFRYEEIAAVLRQRILSGDYGKGRLPSERSLLTEFGVQRDTVRRALDVLEGEGLVFRDPARGTFVLPRAESVNSPATPGTIILAVRRSEQSTGPGDILRGLSRIMEAVGRPIFWFDTYDKQGRPERIPSLEHLRARGVVGAAIWPEMPASLERLRLIRAMMPLVLLDRRVPGFESDFVGFNDADGARKATDHLIRRGHRRIGFISAEPEAATVQARVRGYRAALENAALPSSPEWILHAEQGIRSLPLTALSTFLEQRGAPLTAVLCANDTIAVRFIGILRSLGKRVPEDVAVIGFGNSLPPLMDALGLTTVAQPFERVGQTAGEMLLTRLHERLTENAVPAKVREIELPVELVVRESCGSALSR